MPNGPAPSTPPTQSQGWFLRDLFRDVVDRRPEPRDPPQQPGAAGPADPARDGRRGVRCRGRRLVRVGVSHLRSPERTRGSRPSRERRAVEPRGDRSFAPLDRQAATRSPSSGRAGLGPTLDRSVEDARKVFLWAFGTYFEEDAKSRSARRGQEARPLGLRGPGRARPRSELDADPHRGRHRAASGAGALRAPHRSQRNRQARVHRELRRLRPLAARDRRSRIGSRANGARCPRPRPPCSRSSISSAGAAENARDATARALRRPRLCRGPARACGTPCPAPTPRRAGRASCAAWSRGSRRRRAPPRRASASSCVRTWWPTTRPGSVSCLNAPVEPKRSKQDQGLALSRAPERAFDDEMQRRPAPGGRVLRLSYHDARGGAAHRAPRRLPEAEEGEEAEAPRKKKKRLRGVRYQLALEEVAKDVEIAESSGEDALKTARRSRRARKNRPSTSALDVDAGDRADGATRRCVASCSEILEMPDPQRLEDRAPRRDGRARSGMARRGWPAPSVVDLSESQLAELYDESDGALAHLPGHLARPRSSDRVSRSRCCAI